MQIGWLESFGKHFLDTNIHVSLGTNKDMVVNISHDIIATFMKEAGYHFDIEHSPIDQNNEDEIIDSHTWDIVQQNEKKWFMWKWFKKNFGNKHIS